MSDPYPARSSSSVPEREDKRGFLQKLAEFIHPGPDSRDELLETLSEAEDNHIIGAESRAAMKEALRSIQQGEYAKKFILEGRTNYPEMTARRRLTAEHPIEVVGEQLRAMMPWIKKNKLVDQSKN